MATEELFDWWEKLSLATKFTYREDLEDYLKEYIKIYISKEDLFEIYFNIQKEMDYRKCVGHFPVDFNLDLHMDNHNFDNFKDCVDEILLELAMNFNKWFFTIHIHRNKEVLVKKEILQKIFSKESEN
ncbi:MAG: hypothetical protein POELPBGB_00816 [Bacteroidia bacterium]|nr:hypothetical protein [Bacteroidia bacterium]